MVTIPITGAIVAASLKRVELDISIAGQVFHQTFTTAPNQNYVFTWDERDGYGRAVRGGRPATVTIANIYPLRFAVPAAVAQSFGVPCIGDSTSAGAGCLIAAPWARTAEMLDGRQYQLTLGAFRFQEVGGWTVSAHHDYDQIQEQLNLGTGDRVVGKQIGSTVRGIAGGDAEPQGEGYAGDGGPASLATLSLPRALAIDGVGQVYVVDQKGADNQETGTGLLIRRFTQDGTITTIAGHPTEACSAGPCGDGGPAAAARFAAISALASGPDGSIYVADERQRRVRRIDPQGNISAFAGSGESCDTDLDPTCGEGGPAVSAPLQGPVALAVAADGELLISDFARVRAVRTDGTIRTVLGSGEPCFGGPCGDGAAARWAQIAPGALAADPAGGYYVVDRFAHRIRRVDAGGIISAFAGSGDQCFSFPEVDACGDGGSALLASIGPVHGLALGADGSLFVSDRRIRRIGLEGVVTTVAGLAVEGGVISLRAGLRAGGPLNVSDLSRVCWPKTEDGSLAAGQRSCNPQGLAFLPDGRLLYAAAGGNRVFEIAPPMPKSAVGDMLVGSPDGAERYRFDASGRHLETLNAQTGVVTLTFGYDGAGRLTSIEDAFSNVTRIQRDGSGVPTGIVAPRGQTTAVSVDGNGFLARIVGPEADTTLVTHGATGLLTGLRDPNGFVHTFAYDSTGRLTQDAGPAGGSLAPVQVNDSTGYTVTQTTALGRTASYGVHRLSDGTTVRSVTGPSGLTSTTLRKLDGAESVSEPSGMTTDYTLGPDPVLGLQAKRVSTLNIRSPGGRNFGLVIGGGATTDPLNPTRVLTRSDTVRVNSRAFVTAYDGTLRKYTTTTPMGRQSISFVDFLERVIQTQTPGLNPVSFAYDSLGRVQQVTSGARTIQYAYTSAGFLQRVTDPLGRSTSFTYDNAGRVLAQTNPGGVIGFGYDLGGRLISITPPGKSAHALGYNAIGQGTSYTPPGGAATSALYDADKNLSRSVTADGDTLQRAYDAAGRATGLSLPDGSFSTAYHATTGLVTALKAPSGDSLRFGYDGAMPTSFTWTGAVPGTVGISYNNDLAMRAVSLNGSQLASYSYDADGLLTQAGTMSLARHPQHGAVTGTALGVVQTSYGYNGFGELATQDAVVSGNSVYQVTYARDNGGRITTMQETVEGVTSTWGYTYDTPGRLQDVTLNGTLARSYGYDANGNRTSLTGPGVSIGGSYDGQDRLLFYGSTQYSWNNAGQLKLKITGTDTTRYTYDPFGNLTRAILPTGTDIQYLVDGQHRRIGKKVNGVLVKGWLYQGQLAPVAELDGTGQTVRMFVYASRVNVPDFMIKGGVTYRLVTDHLGSVRLVVDQETGTVAQRLDYDEWGRVTQNTNEGLQPFGYAGGLYDEQTGLVRFGARDYDAEVGRWTAKDPIGFAGGYANLYEYVNNDPANAIDPTGLQRLGIDLALGQGWGQEAAEYWAREALDQGNSGWERAGAEVAGHLSALWTPDTWSQTALTLAGGYAARVIGPFSPRGLPPYIDRIRKYIRFDPPHHGKPWQWDGNIAKWLRNLRMLWLGLPCF